MVCDKRCLTLVSGPLTNCPLPLLFVQTTYFVVDGAEAMFLDDPSGEAYGSGCSFVTALKVRPSTPLLFSYQQSLHALPDLTFRVQMPVVCLSFDV